MVKFLVFLIHFYYIQNSSDDGPSSCPEGTNGSFPVDKSVGVQTDHSSPHYYKVKNS
jgi:hypothetical protein